MLPQTPLQTPRTTRSSTMRAAVLVEPGRFEIQRRPIPEPGPDQVRIRLEGCGVCASNLPPFEGRDWFEYPFEPGAPGHEGWGVIEALGRRVQGLAVGDRVTALSYHAYATHDLAAASHVVKLPDALADTPVLGEPLGCAINIFRRAAIEAGQTVAIVGIGFLGALLVQLAAHAGARVLALSRRPCALEVARQWGAAEALRIGDHSALIARVRELTNGELCERVIEATGEQLPLDLATELTGIRGRLVIAGYHQDGPRQANMQLWNWRGLDVINAHERDAARYLEGMREGVGAVVEGRFVPRPLLTHRFELDALGDAMKLAGARPPGFMKAIVTP
ncbi:MDR/zinc-dependent alcohol dehydrogenase-like family protein [Enhygromyxa salina]|uniref:Sorbitol dehydrogenase n=1 Tax=Enhygromyxa salina TaxID=215803 RepID=A0A2S9XU68_9BACT|nr:zinc-binding dehydrogenase [Enhygromyxa salina]PRP96261.1 Sorbitol dehydrogenase [Enhygromyxa salina]